MSDVALPGNEHVKSDWIITTAAADACTLDGSAGHAAAFRGAADPQNALLMNEEGREPLRTRPSYGLVFQIGSG